MEEPQRRDLAVSDTLSNQLASDRPYWEPFIDKRRGPATHWPFNYFHEA